MRRHLLHEQGQAFGRDLVRHREAVIAAMNGLQLTPLAQEFDAALSDSDLIKASLARVFTRRARR